MALVTSSMVVHFTYFTGGKGFRAPWREAFEYVARDQRDDDAIYGNSRGIATSLSFRGIRFLKLSEESD